MTLLALDIETECALGCLEKCEHALDENRSRISVIGVFGDGPTGRVAETFRTVEGLGLFVSRNPDARFVGQNFKFDLRHLSHHGLDLSAYWAHDTQLMASVLTEKIPEAWLADYELRRLEENKKLPHGYSHRKASLHSLKTLAPYFLGVEPFWENPANHADDTYVLQDCEYTYRLFFELKRRMEERNEFSFYEERLLPWTKLLLQMERTGIALDMGRLSHAEQEAKESAAQALQKLETEWKEHYEAYQEEKEEALKAHYEEKLQKALVKAKDAEKTRARYTVLLRRAVGNLDPLNLDSPTQLTWLLKERLGLDLSTFDGDESTGKPVLNRLGESRDDIKTLLDYRRAKKLSTAFFPSYREMAVSERLHCSFNPTGTRTGRLSSSRPNLQQVPGHLHGLFIARAGHKLATFDMSAIEPRLIAFYTHDETLIHLMQTGADFHGYNAQVFFGLECELKDVKEKHPQERKMAKEVGLSLFYGAEANRLEQIAQKFGFNWGQRKCSEVFARFKEAYAAVYAFRDDVLHPHFRSGDSLPNLLGRPLRFQDPLAVDMQGLNTLIQSSASDLVVFSAHKIWKSGAGMPLLLVHDEIVTEIAEENEAASVALIQKCMTEHELMTPHGRIPLLVEGKTARAWEK